MKIGIACDHAGYDLKLKIIKKFQSKELGFIDFGCENSTISVDYPDIAINLCQNYQKNAFDVGILICGSGIGISIAANRFKEIRAALCHNKEVAILARQHNDANILCLGARILDEETALEVVTTFLETKFLNSRHTIRVQKLSFDVN